MIKKKWFHLSDNIRSLKHKMEDKHKRLLQAVKENFSKITRIIIFLVRIRTDGGIIVSGVVKFHSVPYHFHPSIVKGRS